VDEPEGGYRIVFFHDKNGNGQFDATLAHVAASFELQKLVIHEVKVAMHADLPVPAAYVYRDVWVNAILQNMSLRLQKRNSINDVRCPVEFQLVGPVTTFGGAGSGLTITPNTLATRKAILDAVTGVEFIVVKDAVFAEGNPNAYGVSNVPKGKYKWQGFYYPSIVAIANADILDFHGFNWSHEFGHRKGLGHYTQQDLFPRIMFQGVVSDPAKHGSEVTEKEAKAFRKK
jgi:hypothetical protein